MRKSIRNEWLLCMRATLHVTTTSCKPADFLIDSLAHFLACSFVAPAAQLSPRISYLSDRDQLADHRLFNFLLISIDNCRLIMPFYMVMVNATVAARFSPLFECVYLIEASFSRKFTNFFSTASIF